MADVIITGICGLLGTYLFKALRASGYNVHGLDLQLPNRELLRSGLRHFYLADISDLGRLSTLFAEVHPKLVVHLAALATLPSASSNPSRALEANVLGTANLMEAALRSRVETIVYSSTDKVVGSALCPLSEEVPFCIAEDDVYTRSKIAAESIARHPYGELLRIICFRSVNMIGYPDFNFSRLVPNTLRSIFSGVRPVVYQSSFFREYIYAGDVADAIRKLVIWVADKPVGFNLFNIGSGMRYTPSELVSMLLQIAGMPIDAFDVVDAPGDRPKEFENQQLDSTKLRKALPDWRPHRLEDVLPYIVDAYRRDIGVQGYFRFG